MSVEEEPEEGEKKREFGGSSQSKLSDEFAGVLAGIPLNAITPRGAITSVGNKILWGMPRVHILSRLIKYTVYLMPEVV